MFSSIFLTTGTRASPTMCCTFARVQCKFIFFLLFFFQGLLQCPSDKVFSLDMQLFFFFLLPECLSVNIWSVQCNDHGFVARSRCESSQLWINSKNNSIRKADKQKILLWVLKKEKKCRWCEWFSLAENSNKCCWWTLFLCATLHLLWKSTVKLNCANLSYWFYAELGSSPLLRLFRPFFPPLLAWNIHFALKTFCSLQETSLVTIKPHLCCLAVSLKGNDWFWNILLGWKQFRLDCFDQSP